MSYLVVMVMILVENVMVLCFGLFCLLILSDGV